MSLCDRCSDPGRCCRRLPLWGSTKPEGTTALEALVWLATVNLPHRNGGTIGLPFLPLERAPRYQDPDGPPDTWVWYYSCPNLTDDGRCGDYENRPDLCVHFTPGLDDALCTMRNGARCPTPIVHAAEGDFDGPWPHDLPPVDLDEWVKAEPLLDEDIPKFPGCGARRVQRADAAAAVRQ